MTVRPAHLRLALAALAAAVLYNVWYFAWRQPPASSVRPAAEQPLLAAPAAAVPAAAPDAADPLAIPAPPRITATGPLALARDPFLFGDESRRAVPLALPAAAPPDPVVRSILFSAGRRLAIVDGRIVGLGDQVGAYTVSEIERDAVVFTAPAGGRLRVSVHEGAPAGPAR